ncbi:MAG: lysophospholipid acyltransferase family protein [Sandaracinaceae bacterium]|nr:lysophospholipid acyltransferase family protein [Sandaracinaceae bacterium]
MRKVLKQLVGRTYLAVSGWRTEGERPAPPQFVLIAAPHTTNWDLPVMMALSFVYDVPIRWVGKHTLFKPPGGWLMQALGGIPIVRHERQSRVQTLAALFDEIPDLVLTVPAEGTRSRVEYWKSGFYHIAETADVPIVCGYLDYQRRRGGFGLVIKPSGDIRADMDQIRAFYADKVGKYPEKFGPVRLREEDSEEAEAAA